MSRDKNNGKEIISGITRYVEALEKENKFLREWLERTCETCAFYTPAKTKRACESCNNKDGWLKQLEGGPI